MWNICYQLSIMLTRLLAVSILFQAVFSEGAHNEFATKQEVGDQAHIKQHLENKIEVEKLTEEQQRFHYFSMHDLDKDNRIDGIEIMKALTHDHEHETGPGVKVEDEESMITMIDAVLTDLDLNRDGYVDYAEYTSRQNQINKS